MSRILGGLLAVVMLMASVGAQERSPKAPAPPASVNLNTASVAQLDALPGIGLKVAERITADLARVATA